MKLEKALAAAAATAMAVLGGIVGAPMASAEEVPPPSARLISVVVEPGATVAEVTAEYRCYPGAEYDHLWVSVKQGGHDLEGEGSSARARSWYDSHPAGPDAPVCDGVTHLQTFEVVMHEGYKPLNRSAAWVQFCLVQLADLEDEEAPPLHFLSENQWLKVQAAPSVK